MTALTAARESYVLCRAGEAVIALPVDRVRETMRPLPVTPLSGAPPFVLGVAVIRGVATPVLDPRRLIFGKDTRATRFVTVRLGERSAALAFEAVLGVQELASAILRSLPPLLERAAADVVEKVGTLDTDLLLVLETARVVPDDMWASMEAHGAGD